MHGLQVLEIPWAAIQVEQNSSGGIFDLFEVYLKRELEEVATISIFTEFATIILGLFPNYINFFNEPCL